MRFRASALTNASLSPHLFFNGYVAYGTQTHNVYWKGQVTYAFNKKAYLPREFPQNNISVSWLDDVVSPFDKFVPTDKDNMFTSLRTTTLANSTSTTHANTRTDGKSTDSTLAHATTLSMPSSTSASTESAHPSTIPPNGYQA